MAEYIEKEALLDKIGDPPIWNEYFSPYPFEAHIAFVASIKEMKRFIKEQPAADVVEVRHGEWETVKGVLTPGGDPLLRCPYCKSRESEHLCGVEHPSRWIFCPICGAKMDGKETTNEI